MTRIVSIFAAATLLAAGSAAAATVPPSGKLTFDVMRKGDNIGSYNLDFTKQGDTLTVQDHTDIAVKVPLIGIKLYGFNQTSTETWKGGELAHLTSKTNDDGKKSSIDLGASPLVPGSLWDSDIVSASQALNTITGKTMAIKVAKLGSEQVKTGQGRVETTHYRISGDLARDVWYDSKGLLARVELKGSDGSMVTYVRQ